MVQIFKSRALKVKSFHILKRVIYEIKSLSSIPVCPDFTQPSRSLPSDMIAPWHSLAL